ncbi:PAS/PAC sensor signal transduction histidine kinase [Olavius sp. associated proteobacterium Delta 1]|nr:PAS/PAC sensor signal transduction histidine kinase [Olavius sp. associated proteobacterium Delta 1]
MKLRVILLVLSLLAFLSASTGGYLYYASLKKSAFKEAERQAVARVQTIKKNLSFYLSENRKPVRALAGMKELRQVLIQPIDLNAMVNANAVLDHFNKTLDTEVCYLMTPEGDTIASSNRNAPDSFVGMNFDFRPYFQQAIHGKPATYLALGTASGRRGAYFSHPIPGIEPGTFAGVVVIKASIEQVEKELVAAPDEIVLVTDPQGIVFISNRKNWLYHSLMKLTPEQKSRIEDSIQFGHGPWIWTGLTTKGEKYAADSSGNEYLLHRLALDNYSGWKIIHLRSLKAISKTVLDPLIKITGPLILALCVLIGLSVFLLYRKASVEILKRLSAEKALRKSEERYRSLYHHTPAMLHSIDTDGCLVSVSDYWLEVLGYERDEVIGRKLTDFYTESSRRYAEEVVLPEFFKAGFCQDISYRFVKKNGDEIDILLSAISDRDASGKPARSLAVSIDVTERKHAEEALELAKEELRRYSEDLERLVKKQTQEITSILRYTPAIVSIKDRDGRYVFVNSRFEELFAMRNEEVRGKTDYDIFPADVADQLRHNDLKVLSQGSSYQVEEHIPLNDSDHTYLSVKFPVYDDSDTTSGVCGISTDITAVKKAQNQLRRLSGNIMTSQEKERSAIARELHDELGQMLTALRMDSAWLQERLKISDPAAAERAKVMDHLIDMTIQDVRSMAFRLRPGVLDDLGLVDALEWYTSDFERRTGITCIFEHNQVSDINDTVATASYRITQEALTNIARHAFAGHVDVVLKQQREKLTLLVADNGCGFDILELSESQGLGVAGMRERASLAGGILEVQSRPENGTRVYFKVPVLWQDTELKIVN